MTYDLGTDTTGCKAANRRVVVPCARGNLEFGPVTVDTQQSVYNVGIVSILIGDKVGLMLGKA